MPDKRGFPSICWFDIEATDLKADWGYMLCFGYQLSPHAKIHVPSLIDFPNIKSDPTDDRKLTQEAVRVLGNADMWVSWYGKRFDIRFILARCAEHKIQPPPMKPHVDLWETARSNWALTSNRLANVQAHLGTPDEKTPIQKRIWRKARAGHRPSLRYIMHHCRQDIAVLKQVYEEMRPYISQHPNMQLFSKRNKWGACPTCGEFTLVSNGKRVAKTRVYRSFKCNACGSYCQSRMNEKEYATDVVPSGRSG